MLQQAAHQPGQLVLCERFIQQFLPVQIAQRNALARADAHFQERLRGFHAHWARKHRKKILYHAHSLLLPCSFPII